MATDTTDNLPFTTEVLEQVSVHIKDLCENIKTTIELDAASAEAEQHFQLSVAAIQQAYHHMVLAQLAQARSLVRRRS